MADGNVTIMAPFVQPIGNLFKSATSIISGAIDSFTGLVEKVPLGVSIIGGLRSLTILFPIVMFLIKLVKSVVDSFLDGCSTTTNISSGAHNLFKGMIFRAHKTVKRSARQTPLHNFSSKKKNLRDIILLCRQHGGYWCTHASYCRTQPLV